MKEEGGGRGDLVSDDQIIIVIIKSVRLDIIKEKDYHEPPAKRAHCHWFPVNLVS
jgi:hypothetical protein